ncbi:phospho-N-acetylmuramoyl-pentapeptide-transferase [Roseibacillus ishigakijimensis]|uniref:Phospho-N-acetylmuramoyl-pentapeptide-transferase n=2 Tax=Roseibacillus ishigakijimensis TaxID=454146 RepID=A0A934RTE6_9BACT|nr:phospho-N-acetylmuramoyl-pentapeptide-transferase [Roseibacillus ishigakijimensis]MBK1835301.1 phospho-N-acetylmuramoyl-pentapeptide-transferase [Roseibacillus ishigakijimensis]
MFYWIYEIWMRAHEAGESWADTFSFLRLFRYLSIRGGMAAFITFGLCLVFGPRVIRKLISLKVGQPIRTAEEVHKLAELHGQKAGTPTMGGVMILGSVLIAVLLCGRVLNPFVTVTMCAMLGLGLLGFVDDYAKVVKKTSDGVSGKTKLFWQMLVGLLVALFLYTKPETNAWLFADSDVVWKETTRSISDLSFPLSKSPLLPLGLLAIPFFILVIMGASNAVNLTDGLDGLAIGCTITVSLAYAVLAYVAGNENAHDYLNVPFNPMVGELVVVMMALVGAGFGFLWFNCYPAKVFMGDTGSLAIGGCIGTTAICVRQELLLVIIGGIFVMEALSVVLQVASFKSTGKRIFRMSPIHHHFELGGWKETQVITRFWILSILFALIGLATLKIL